MPDDLVILAYEFLFNPSETWAHLSQFEEDLAKFLAEHGMEAKILDSINPSGGRRVMWIRDLKEIGAMGEKEEVKEEPITPQQFIRKNSKDK